MSTTSGGSVTKARFKSVDTGDTLEVQYNPSNFKFNKPVSWKEHDDQGTEAGLEYQKNSPATMQAELIFDTTGDESDVRSVWVNQLLEFTNPEVPPSGGEASSLSKLRPHRVEFTWGSFSLTGVIENIDVTYLMFASSGNPLRAKVTVKMKEWKPEDKYQGSGSGAYYDSQSVSLCQVQAGDTAASIAARELGDASRWREVADANPGMDVANPTPGSSVITRS